MQKLACQAFASKSFADLLLITWTPDVALDASGAQEPNPLVLLFGDVPKLALQFSHEELSLTHEGEVGPACGDSPDCSVPAGAVGWWPVDAPPVEATDVDDDVAIGHVDDWEWRGPSKELAAVAKQLEMTDLVERAERAMIGRRI